MNVFALYIFLCASVFVQCQSVAQKENPPVTIATFPTGIYASNSYVVSCAHEGFMVDAGSSDTAIGNYIKRNEIEVRYIFCTHSHIDHVLYAMDMKALTGAKIVLHQYDRDHYKYYTQERIQGWIQSGELSGEQMPMIDKFIQIKYDTLLKGGEVFMIGGMKVEVLYTPGHSKGSVCILVNGRYLFTGDTIFDNSIGNTDIDTGSDEDIMQSIHKIILPLSDTISLYQGHGKTVTLKEVRSNIQ